MCPLKDAAKDAPNNIACLSKDGSISYSQLDQLVDSIMHVPLIFPVQSPLQFITYFFAAYRQNKALFPINPQLKKQPMIQNGPPSSLLLFTSGSTADAKIAILPFETLFQNAKTVIQSLDLKANDQWKLNLPLFHVGGIGITLRCIFARATIVFDDSPNITHLSCVPTHLYRYTPIYPHLRCLLVGGAPIPSYPYPIWTTYGLTEMGSMVTLNGALLPKRQLHLNPDGEILVQGPTLFKGYLNCAEQKGWFATKDLGKFENNRLIITGRKDWMFISGGENIQPEEIEKELLFLPEIIDAVVVAKNDPEFGKRPVAFICAQKSINLKRVRTHLCKKLPSYKIPIAFHILSEFPKKNTLKTDRFILSQIVNK